MKAIKIINNLTVMILTSILVTLALTSCYEDAFEEDHSQDVILPVEESKDLSNIEQYSYSIPFEVKAKGEWEISFRFNEGHQICYALPAKGKGPATVKICVLDNWTDERRTGEVTIRDLQDPSSSHAYKLVQKCNLDYGTRASEQASPSKGNIIYGVGYGYNVYKPFSSAISLSPIVRVEEFKESGVIHTEGTQTKDEFVQYTGSCLAELVSDFKTKAKANANASGFGAELSAAFGTKDFKSNEKEYMLSEVNVVKNSVFIDNMNDGTLSNYYMCDEAYANINGIPYVASDDREAIINFPNTDKGFYDLVKTYGTHLIIKAKTGGRIRFATTIDVSKVNGEYDLSSFAKCNYSSTLFGSAKGDVSEDLKKSYSNSRKAASSKISVYGGDENYANKIQNGEEKQIYENYMIINLYPNIKCVDAYNYWYWSLNKVSNQKVVSVDQESLIPLWELVNEAEAGGRTRKAMLRDYIENRLPGVMANEQSEQGFETGTVACINIPSFKDEMKDGTLIKDVYNGGQHVARVCNEFIPQINKLERINVIYPVANGKVKYNMGYFPGDENQKPYRVCCTDTDIKVQEITSAKKGTMNQVFLRGSSFYTPENNDVLRNTQIVDTKINNAYIEAPSSTWDARPFAGKYQMVKIFNRIWQRSQYCEVIDGHRLHYYPRDVNKFSVKNWHVATVSDWKNLSDGLTKRAGFNLPASKMFTDSNYNATDLSGFGIYWGGWESHGKKCSGHNNDQMEYMTHDEKGNYGHVRILKTGSLEICGNDFNYNNWRMCVRLVQPLQ